MYRVIEKWYSHRKQYLPEHIRLEIHAETPDSISTLHRVILNGVECGVSLRGSASNGIRQDDDFMRRLGDIVASAYERGRSDREEEIRESVTEFLKIT